MSHYTHMEASVMAHMWLNESVDTLQEAKPMRGVACIGLNGSQHIYGGISHGANMNG